MLSIMIRASLVLVCVTVLVLPATATALAQVSATTRAPVVTAVSPNSGFLRGGNTLVVAGSGLNSVTGVYFGTSRSYAITHDGNHRLSVVVPAHAAGTVHVQVAGPYGESAPVPPDRYNYVAGLPHLAWRRAAGFNPFDVSCVSSTFCAGVSWNKAGGTAAVFDGHAWSTPQVIARHRHLTGISCGSADFCVAPVYEDGTAIVERDGTWGAPTSIDSAGRLTEVSCAAPDFCVVIDDRGAAITYSDGMWHDPVVVDTHRLMDVSCTSPDFCLAVDGLDEVTYDGSAWSSPVATGIDYYVQRVDCASPDGCDGDGTAVRRHGVWAMVQPPEGSQGIFNLSCASTILCVNIPNSSDFSINNVMDGAAFAYTGYPSPLPRADLYGGAVSCAADNSCMVAIDYKAYVAAW
jgi:hypothetical protein